MIWNFLMQFYQILEQSENIYVFLYNSELSLMYFHGLMIVINKQLYQKCIKHRDSDWQKPVSSHKSQSEASILVTWSFSPNQGPIFIFSGHVITLGQLDASIHSLRLWDLIKSAVFKNLCLYLIWEHSFV